MYQANVAGAPPRMALSAWSKSSSRLNAATPMMTRLKMIASGPPSRSPVLMPNRLITRLNSISTMTPTMAPSSHLVNRGVTRTAPVL